jgi:hypothetical protein
MSQEDLALELIIQYGMDEIEAKAFKIACIYLEKSRKMFPNYQHYRLPKGDPRKSELFRHCHKLVREKQGKIADSEYQLYVHAQLDILRNIKKGDLHPFITPSCLSSENAWKRWLLWKSKYDKHLESRASAAVASTVNVHTPQKIKKDLWKTKQFFLAWFDRLDAQDIQESLKDANIFRWHQTGSVCGYYLVISPIVNKWLQKNPIDLKKEFSIDMSLYTEANRPEIIDYFNAEFPHEKG